MTLPSIATSSPAHIPALLVNVCVWRKYSLRVSSEQNANIWLYVFPVSQEDEKERFMHVVCFNVVAPACSSFVESSDAVRRAECIVSKEISMTL